MRVKQCGSKHVRCAAKKEEFPIQKQTTMSKLRSQYMALLSAIRPSTMEALKKAV